VWACRRFGVWENRLVGRKTRRTHCLVALRFERAGFEPFRARAYQRRDARGSAILGFALGENVPRDAAQNRRNTLSPSSTSWACQVFRPTDWGFCPTILGFFPNILLQFRKENLYTKGIEIS